jgi:hypothetical protein
VGTVLFFQSLTPVCGRFGNVVALEEVELNHSAIPNLPRAA